MASRPNAETWQHTRILDAAYDLVQQEGCENLTMRGVAARLGQSPASLYRHFSGITELSSALSERAATQLLDFLHLLPPSADTKRHLLALSRAFAAWNLARPELFRLSTLVCSRPETAPTPEGRLLSLLAALFQEGRTAGLFSHRDDTAAAAHHLASLHGAVYLALSHRLGRDAERDRLLEAILSQTAGAIGA